MVQMTYEIVFGCAAAWLFVSCDYYRFDLETRCAEAAADGRPIPTECDGVDWVRPLEDRRCAGMECGEDRGEPCGACEGDDWCDDVLNLCLPKSEIRCDGMLVSCEDDEIANCTSSGELKCCTTEFSHFCDDEGVFSAACWNTDVDCSQRISCNERQHACVTGSLPYCTEASVSLCCPEEEKFCDDAPGGIPGACWPAGIDCSTIAWCEDKAFACFEGNEYRLHCSSSGNTYCCLPEQTFCDEHPDDLADACYNSPDVDCGTIMDCGAGYLACTTGHAQYCLSNGKGICCGLDIPVFCPDRAVDGYEGGCWPEGVDCADVTDCGGEWMACPDSECGPGCLAAE